MPEQRKQLPGILRSLRPVTKQNMCGLICRFAYTEIGVRIKRAVMKIPLNSASQPFPCWAQVANGSICYLCRGHLDGSGRPGAQATTRAEGVTFLATLVNLSDCGSILFGKLWLTNSGNDVCTYNLTDKGKN